MTAKSIPGSQEKYWNPNPLPQSKEVNILRIIKMVNSFITIHQHITKYSSNIIFINVILRGKRNGENKLVLFCDFRAVFHTLVMITEIWNLVAINSVIRGRIRV